MSQIQLEGALRYVVSMRAFWPVVIVGAFIGVTTILALDYSNTCEPRRYDYLHPPRICQLGCASGDVWSWRAKMCVMSCSAAGCL